MGTQSPSDNKTLRESGTVLHRSETNWQIYFPFLLGILVLVIMFLAIALPTEPEWRDRAQAVGDFLYTFLCMLPMLVCMLPIHLVILVSIYGMKKVHEGTERPLRKLENAAASLAERIERVTDYINEKAVAFDEAYEPIDDALGIFDPIETSVESPQEESMSDESNKSGNEETDLES